MKNPGLFGHFLAEADLIKGGKSIRLEIY
jgi:hypothetical protein